MRYVGIDPGSTGACVVVADDGRTVLDQQRWWGHKVPPRLTIIEPGDIVALEAQHVGRGNRSSLTLAEWAGSLIATLPEGITLLRPLATTWRARVLRQGRLQREPAKRLAIAAATPHLPGPVTHDAAEAWCLARYAWGWHMAHPGGQ